MFAISDAILKRFEHVNATAVFIKIKVTLTSSLKQLKLASSTYPVYALQIIAN